MELPETKRKQNELDKKKGEGRLDTTKKPCLRKSVRNRKKSLESNARWGSVPQSNRQQNSLKGKIRHA